MKYRCGCFNTSFTLLIFVFIFIGLIFLTMNPYLFSGEEKEDSAEASLAFFFYALGLVMLAKSMTILIFIFAIIGLICSLAAINHLGIRWKKIANIVFCIIHGMCVFGSLHFLILF